MQRKPFVVWLLVAVAGVALAIWGRNHPVHARPVPGDPFAATLDGWLVWSVLGLGVAGIAAVQLLALWRKR